MSTLAGTTKKRRMVRRSVLIATLFVCFLSVLAAGCRRAQARVMPDIPPLDVPLPPPRLVETAEAEPPEPVSLMPEPARNPPPRLPPVTPARSEPKPEAPKVEVAPVEAQKPVEEPRAQAPTTTLRTTTTEREGEVERRINALLLEARGNLNRTDYNRLNVEAKGQYDSAKGFVRQAEEALRMKNLLFANFLADKAAVLAAQLRGR